MELKGKKIVFLGDSITEGVGTSGVDKQYVTLVGQRGEFREYKNYGISGTRFAKQINNTDPIGERAFCLRVEELDEDADVVVVFGGTNDFGHADGPIGTFEDRALETFYGACHHIMSRLHERFLGKTIVIMTPLHRHNEDNPKGDWKVFGTAPLKTYVNIIREMAEYYSIPVLDLYAESGIQPRLQVLRDAYCPDGLHPNDAGHELIAAKLLSFLSNL